MLESVVSLIETNVARTSSIQELVAPAARLKDLVTQMHDKTVEVNTASIGKAAAKMEARIALRETLSIVKAGLFAHAVRPTAVGLAPNLSSRQRRKNPQET